MKTRLGYMILGWVAFCGCDVAKSSNAKILLPQVNAVDESLPRVAHPEYANWSQFAEKTLVVRKRTVANAAGTVVVKTKMWLERKDANGVAIGSQVTVERPGEPIVENDEDIVPYPATYRLPTGMDEARFLLPSARAKETGTEVIHVGDRNFNAKIFEWDESNETGPMSVKLWRSDEMPGKTIRQEMLTKSSETKSTEEVIEFHEGDNPN